MIGCTTCHQALVTKWKTRHWLCSLCHSNSASSLKCYARPFIDFRHENWPENPQGRSRDFDLWDYWGVGLGEECWTLPFPLTGLWNVLSSPVGSGEKPQMPTHFLLPTDQFWNISDHFLQSRFSTQIRPTKRCCLTMESLLHSLHTKLYAYF